MKYFLILFLFSITFVQPAFTQQKKFNLIKEGMDACYNFNWVKGKSSFDNLISKFPDEPDGNHYKSIMHLWFYLGSSEKVYLDSFYYYSDKAIKLSQEKFSQDSLTAYDYLLRGNIYISRAVAHGRSGNFFEAFLAAQNSKSFLDDALKIDSTLFDAYLGLGMYNLALSQIPPGYKWASDLIGLEGSILKADSLLKICEQKGNLNKVDAKFYLSQANEKIFHNYEEGLKRTGSLVKKYPKNKLFQLSNASLQLKNKQIAKAEKTLKSIIASNDSLFPYIKNSAEILLGNSFFIKNDYKNAEKYYSLFLKENSLNDFKGLANFRLGIIKAFNGDKDSAKIFFRRAINSDTDIEEDIYAKRLSRIFSDKLPNKTELLLVYTGNLIEAGNFKQAKKYLTPLLNMELNKEHKAIVYYQYSLIYQSEKKFDKMKRMALNVINLKPVKEKWLIAHSYYLAAVSSFILDERRDAKIYLSKAEENNEYDFRLQLRNFIQLLKAEIKIQ